MKYVVANWKMKMDSHEALDWDASSVADAAGLGVHVVVAPSFAHIPLLYEKFDSVEVSLSAQDVSVFDKGAHTGDVGAFQLDDFCKFCIVGHSEREESVEVVKEKIQACLKYDIIPIVCFVTPKQVKEYLSVDGVSIVAWEDPENISKEGVLNPKNNEEVVAGVADLREFVPSKVVVLYGGSVSRQNACDLAKIEGLDGVLVGSASLDSTHFAEIAKAFAEE